ncbi:hypothetical protein K439DRAFT_1016334 [Ramaria rubella]|nr:hypothetical protein K439DRAFT_1016334 [Ramaria rubella]
MESKPESQPDISRVGEALKVLSEELPRLSNLLVDSAAIVQTLRDLREDLRRSLDQQIDLKTLLDTKLKNIQETLLSLEARIENQDTLKLDDDFPNCEQLAKTGRKDLNSLSTVRNQQSTSGLSASSQNTSPHVTHSGANGLLDSGLLRGPSGALIIIIICMIPILCILMLAE